MRRARARSPRLCEKDGPKDEPHGDEPHGEAHACRAETAHAQTNENLMGEDDGECAAFPALAGRQRRQSSGPVRARAAEELGPESCDGSPERVPGRVVRQRLAIFAARESAGEKT